MTTMINLTARSTYSYFEQEKLRFSDTDLIGHVNNVAFAAILESGRTAFAHREINPYVPSGMMMVMARIEIDYRRELHWPATVDIGVRIVSIGNRSWVVGQGIFRDELCYTTGRTTLVLIDQKTRKPVELPPACREVLERLMEGEKAVVQGEPE